MTKRARKRKERKKKKRKEKKERKKERERNEPPKSRRLSTIAKESDFTTHPLDLLLFVVPGPSNNQANGYAQMGAFASLVPESKSHHQQCRIHRPRIAQVKLTYVPRVLSKSLRMPCLSPEMHIIVQNRLSSPTKSIITSSCLAA